MTGDERRRAPSHDPRTEWIADGCSSWITDTLVAIPLVVAALVVAALTGMPFWAGLLAAVAVVWAVGAVRRVVRRPRHDPERREPEI